MTKYDLTANCTSPVYSGVQVIGLTVRLPYNQPLYSYLMSNPPKSTLPQAECTGWTVDNIIDYQECKEVPTTPPPVDPGTGGGSGGTGDGTTFSPAPSGIYIGKKPMAEFVNTCAAVPYMWNNFPTTEIYGYLTVNGQVIVTDQLNFAGGTTYAPYVYQGSTYYVYPVSQGAPSYSYYGMKISAGNYYIPVIASIHTHTPCRLDGTDGVSHPVGTEDLSFAGRAAGIRHWVIGCDAIAQFNSSSSIFLNIIRGDIHATCSSIR